MKTNPFRLLFFGVTTLVLVAAFTMCTKDVGVVPVASACDTVSYTQDIKRTVDNHCVECHNSSLASAGYNFSTYEGLKKASDDGQLYYAIFVAVPPDKMPQDSVDVLTNLEKDLIRCWIENGEKQ